MGLESATAAAGQPLKTVFRCCPLCGRDNAAEPSLEYAPAEWPMKDCPRCRMVYLERAPDLSELYENVAWEKRFALGNADRHGGMAPLEQGARRALRKFRPLPRKRPSDLAEAFAPDGNVLDVGCGSGEHLAALGPRHVPFGIEISTALAKEAQVRVAPRGGAMINGDALAALEQLAEGAFAAVIMRSFLEHDINPWPILKASARVLRPAGVVIIKVPNYGSWNRRVRGAKWCGLRFPDHVNYFTPRTLRRMVESTGLEVVRFGLFERPPTSDNMWLIARRAA